MLPVEIPERSVTEDEEKPKRVGRTGWIALAACLTVMAVAGARYLAIRQGSVAQDFQPEPVVQSAAPAPSAPIAPVAKAPPAPDPTASEDPAEVVRQWELAMQSRDASSQAAFYSDPVERYFLRRNVGKDAVVADKQASIDKRKDTWTVTMDRVKVTTKGDVANVSLVKHFIVRQEGSPVSEWFIPARLQLKHAEGKWKIVSERDLGWVTSLDDLDG
jgi:ketosteroid isomerase-like protein